MSPENKAKMIQWVNEGVPKRIIAERLGCSISTIHYNLFVSPTRDTKSVPKRRGDTHHAAESVSKDDVRDMEVAALKREVERLRADSPEPRAPIEPEVDDIDWSKQWEQVEARNAKIVERESRASTFHANFPGDEPIAVSFVSDQHISVGAVDLKRMREDAEIIANTPGIYACLGGDSIDNHIRHRSAMIMANSTPDDQYNLFSHYLSILREKVLVLISGNHDLWATAMAGVDVIQRIAQEKKVAYAKNEARIDLNVGGQSYDIAFRHQFRMNSTFNQTHAVKQWFRLGEKPFDVGCVCHNHEPAMESARLHGQKRYLVRPGSYQITTQYGEQYGFSKTDPSSPTIVFYPRARRMIGFDDVRDAAHWLGK